jgi:hypothetical protein
VNATVHPLVAGYLRSLDGAAKVLPRRERDELVSEIRGHLDEALSPEASEADVRNVLDSLGPPWDIVAAAGGQQVTVRRGAREVFALLLLVTGLPPIIGWVVGLGLLIWSPLWTARQKWLGALVWPGGWLGAFIAVSLPAGGGSSINCTGAAYGSAANAAAACVTTHTGPPAWVPALILGVVLALPILVASYLWRAAGRASAT